MSKQNSNRQNIESKTELLELYDIPTLDDVVNSDFFNVHHIIHKSERLVALSKMLSALCEFYEDLPPMFSDCAEQFQEICEDSYIEIFYLKSLQNFLVDSKNTH